MSGFYVVKRGGAISSAPILIKTYKRKKDLLREPSVMSISVCPIQATRHAIEMLQQKQVRISDQIRDLVACLDIYVQEKKR